MKVSHRSAILLLGVTLLASGCGSSRNAAGADPPDDIEPTGTPAPFIAQGTTLVPEADQSTLAIIRERGEMRVGVLYNNPPFGRLTPEGDLFGFEVDLVRALAEQWGVDVEFVQVTRQTRISYLLNGQVDMLAATVPHRRELHELVDFSQTIFRSGYVMLVPDDSEIETVADLNGRAVGIVEDASFEVLAEQSRALGVTPTAQQFDSSDNAVDALLGGRVSAVVARREDLMRATQNHPELTLRDRFLLVEPYAFVVRRGDSNFRNLIDLTLQGLARDGSYADVFDRHLYGYPADKLVLWPGDDILAFESQPVNLDPPLESRAVLVARGDPMKVAVMGSGYDDPELDGQRLVDDFNRALVNEFARRWGIAIDEVSADGADGVVGLVTAGQADLAFGVVSQREHALSLDFSQVYLEQGMRLVRHADSSIESIADLDAESVAVLGTSEDRGFVTTDNTGVQVVDVTSSRHALTLLQSGEVSVVLADELTAGLIAREDPTLVLLGEAYNSRPYVVVVPRFDSDFRALVNFTLQIIYADGTLGRLATQYFGPYFPDDQPAAAYPVEIWPGSDAFLRMPDAR